MGTINIMILAISIIGVFVTAMVSAKASIDLNDDIAIKSGVLMIMFSICVLVSVGNLNQTQTLNRYRKILVGYNIAEYTSDGQLKLKEEIKND